MLKDLVVDHEESAPSGAGSSLGTSLLLRLKGPDPDAWKTLTMLYGPEVYRWCRRAGLSVQDAEDVGQEVFRAVAKHLGEFRRERPGDSFRGWLYTITRNKLRDHWRRNAGQPEAAGGSDAQLRLGQVPDEEDASSAGVGPDTDGLARQALELIRSSFEERTWKAFWQVAVEERPAADVARDLGMSANAVYIARSRVLGRLRAELGELLS